MKSFAYHRLSELSEAQLRCSWPRRRPLAGAMTLMAAGNNEGNPHWGALPRSPRAMRTGARAANPELGMNTEGCNNMDIKIFLKDHQGGWNFRIVLRGDVDPVVGLHTVVDFAGVRDFVG